jgi:antitoxin (DNA-binding transcriptional repressor) of toxin-antitoxin stability system
MKIVTVRDFRTRPKQVREALQHEQEAVLTVNGRPVALLIPTDAGTIDETVETVRRARGLEALRAIRRESLASGRARLAAREVGAVIARTRRARGHRARARAGR